MTQTSSGPVCDVCGEYILLEDVYIFGVKGVGIDDRKLQCHKKCETVLKECKKWEDLPDGPLRRGWEKVMKEDKQ